MMGRFSLRFLMGIGGTILFSLLIPHSALAVPWFEIDANVSEELDLDQLRTAHTPPGIVTVIKNFDDNSAQIDWTATRSGEQKYSITVRDIIKTWKYRNSPKRGRAKITVDAVKGSIRLDLEDLSEIVYNSDKLRDTIRFPNPDEKEKYAAFTNFQRDNITVLLYPPVVKRELFYEGPISVFIERLHPGFFVIFCFLLLSCLWISIHSLASSKSAGAIFVASVVIFVLLLIFHPFQRMGWVLFWYAFFCILLIAATLILTIKNKGALYVDRLEYPRETLQEIERNWEKQMKNHRAIIVSSDPQNTKRAKWDNTVLPKLSRLIKKINRSSTEAPSPWANVLMSGIQNHINNTIEWQCSQEIDRSVDRAIDSEIERLKGRRLDWLFAIAGLAPMIGLFGTVIGIAVSFGKIARYGALLDPVERINRLAAGINMALYTTIVGLIIGILSLVFYYLVKSRLDFLRSDWYNRIVKITNPV